jgi:branched-chain amino acid transport system permease protein
VANDVAEARASLNVLSTKLSQRALILALVMLAALLPQMTSSPYWLSVSYQAELLICLAVGLNIVVGYAGLLDLGFAAFFAIGAYTTALLSVKEHWTILATIPPGILIAEVCAVVIGMPTLRLRSDYLAVVTLGFGMIIQTIATNLTQTGGPTGIYGIPTLTIGSVVIQSATSFYYVFFVMAVLFIFITLRLRHSRIGRAWLCIREDEDAALAMGIKIKRYKLYAYMTGAAMGSIAGSLYAPALTAISPPSFGFNESLLILMALAIGGMGSVGGAILGGAVVVFFPEVFRQFASARLLVFGFALIIIMLTRPRGLLPEGTFRGAVERLRSWSHKSSGSTALDSMASPEDHVPGAPRSGPP